MNILRFGRSTNTTKFILPFLFDENTRYQELFDNLFVNAYIADMANKDNDDEIHLVFADYPSLKLTQKIANPFTEYEYKDGYVLVYSLDNKWIDDYNKIILGKYSTISVEAKYRILSFWEEDNKSPLYSVLFKEGKAVRKFVQEITGDKINEPWSREKEWWLPFKLPEEVLGLAQS